MAHKATHAVRALCALCLALCLSAAAGAQNIISGTVTDDSSQPVVGATVMVKGTTTGAVTGLNGDYNISAPADATLVFTFMGLSTHEEAVGGRTRIDVQMSAQDQALGDVVVIGYGTVKKGDLTGSVTAVNADKLQRGLATSASDLLVGKIAGVSVTTDGGTPGGGAQIRIRGGSSLSASNDPLIVIDGLAIDNDGIQGVANPLAMVNPADIETFTVLKDASATAIYGSRASNGVIIITTKRGVASKTPQVNYTGNFSVSTLVKRQEVLTGDELRQYAKELKYSDKVQAYLGAENTDWQSQIYRPAFGTDHNLSVAGALKTLPYRVSAGYTNQNGIIKTSNMERFTAALNLNPTFLDKHLSVNAAGKAMYIKNRYADGGVVGASLVMDPTQPVYGGNDAELQKFYGGYFQRYAAADYNDTEWVTRPLSDAPKNPLATLEQKDDQAKSYDLIGNIEVDYKIHGFEDLHLHANLGGDYAHGRQDTKISPYSGDYSNHYYGWNGYTVKTKYNASFNAYAQYAKDISVHHIDAMAGYEWQHFYNDGNSDGSGMYPATQKDPALANAPYNKNPTEWATENYLVSFFGRLNYSLFNRYLLTVTLRNDGSSRFAKEHRWGLFPSAALSWKIKEESFLQDVDAISTLSLRLSYGKTGQQNINQGNYPYLPTYTLSQAHANYPIGVDANGNYVYESTYRPGAVNPDLTWETTTTYNAGLDFGFLSGRISGSVDVYHRITDNLINVVDVPAGSNFKNRVISNVGSLTNNGVELSLNAHALQAADYSWNIGFNLTHNINEITKLTTGSSPDYFIPVGGISSGTGNNIQANRVGYPANTFYVYETAKDANGNYYIVNQNGDKDTDGKDVIDASDLRMYRHAAPDYMLSLNSRFTYKNWDFGISLRASIGNYVYNDVLANNLRNVPKNNHYSTKYGGFLNIYTAAYDAYWADGFKADRLVDNAFLADYFIENASFLRCDNITVGYTFKSIASWKCNLRVYATVQNPFVITGYSGLDPELSSGIDNNIYPRSMVSLIGLSLGF